MLNQIISEIKKRVAYRQDEFEIFAQELSLIRLEKNDIWEQKGEISQNMGFVNSGILRQYFLEDDTEYTDCFHFENEFIGNYISYLSQKKSETYTIAIEPCELLVIPFKELENLYKVVPTIEQFSKIIGEEKLFELKERNSALLLKSPEERYYDLIKDRSELLQRIPQYLIAQYLGIRPESLSRIRKRHLS